MNAERKNEKYVDLLLDIFLNHLLTNLSDLTIETQYFAISLAKNSDKLKFKSHLILKWLFHYTYIAVFLLHLSFNNKPIIGIKTRTNQSHKNIISSTF